MICSRPSVASQTTKFAVMSLTPSDYLLIIISLHTAEVTHRY